MVLTSSLFRFQFMCFDSKASGYLEDSLLSNANFISQIYDTNHLGCLHSGLFGTHTSNSSTNLAFSVIY